MPLYEMTSAGGLSAVPSTTFAGQGVLERTDLQRALREHIGVLDDGLLVVAEEFGDFVDARRRVDLLCVDRQGQLVVVELKRTEDGGHMELQALRYAAMVSTMTFDQAR
ncbi:MAG: endonuclease NucS [Actinomycetota bacterium]|nr:endonuclease NucS [Actinomycetota bacterium]